MLNGVLSLHDIKDVERFCAQILKRKGLTGPDHEELLTFLVEETWLLSGLDKHGNQVGPIRWHSSFSGWITPILHLRLIDHVRQTQGDHRYQTGRHRHQHIPLDLRPDHPHPTPQRDHPPDRNADHLVRLLRTRSSDEAWRHHKRRPRLPNRTT